MEEHVAVGVQVRAAQRVVGEVELVRGEGQTGDPDHVVAAAEAPGFVQGIAGGEVEIGHEGKLTAIDQRIAEDDRVAVIEQQLPLLGVVAEQAGFARQLPIEPLAGTIRPGTELAAEQVVAGPQVVIADVAVVVEGPNVERLFPVDVAKADQQRKGMGRDRGRG